jgi:hypothetical protein
MSNGMTGGLPDPPLLGWRADLGLASLTRGLGHLDQAHSDCKACDWPAANARATTERQALSGSRLVLGA